MAKNDFRVASIFKIIIKICLKNVEFCWKTSKFLPKRCLFVFCIFYLNEKVLNQEVCLKKKQKRERQRSKNIIQFQKHF